MLLSLKDVERITADVARGRDPSLQVVAAMNTDGGSEYIEVTLRGCGGDPCVLMIGVDRTATERVMREAIDSQLRQHLESHP